MGRKRMDSNLFLYLISISILILMTSPIVIPASGNPIPMDVVYDGRSGGTPVPGSEQSENLTIFLMEETIRANIHEDHAEVEAEYVFHDNGSAYNEVEICLPFVNEPRDVKAAVNGEDLSFTWSWFSYEPISDSEYDWERGQDSLSCILFSIPVSNNSETTVVIKYESQVSIYDSSLNSDVTYWFSYLVGSGRYWNHSIGKALFEFKIPTYLYDRGMGEQWNRSRKGNDLIFTLEFDDWTPSQDFVEIRWERDRGAIDEFERLFTNSWNDSETRPFMIVCGGILIVLILIPILVLYKYGKKKRANSQTPK